jgi:hypothetical protein
MNGILDAVLEQWGRLRKGSTPVPVIEPIPPGRCLPEKSAGYPIISNKMYFSARVNQMHLVANREWWVKFDPLVVFVVEFGYGGKRIAIPKVVGPSLIPEVVKGGAPKHGIVLEDVLIAGPHPYRGGEVALSVRFYQVPRDDLARSIMTTIGTLSKEVPVLRELDTAMLIGGAILDGVEGLLRIKDTTCLAAFYLSLDPSNFKPFSGQFCALVTPPVPDSAALKVVDRRLKIVDGKDEQPYSGSDFVLFSVEGATERRDLNPFDTHQQEAMAVMTTGEDGTKRAKAMLLTAYGDMLRSPDMIADQADAVFLDWQGQFAKRQKILESLNALPLEERPKEPDPLGDKLNGAVHALSL